MAVIPLIFLIQPLVVVFALPASAAAGLSHEHLLLYMLGIPAIVPAAVAAYAVVGERQQGTLEPVLTTPIRREEFLLGKALAALVPSVAIAYAVYALFLACVGLFAPPAVASALLRGPDLLAQLLFTPLLAGWSIWVGIAISARSSDFRVAQQLGTLASLPPAVVSGAHRVQRDPRDARPCPRPRGGAAAPRRPRLADHVSDLRPRTTHHRDQKEAAMRYVNLGNTGLRVSRVCLGMMSFGRHQTRQWALDEAAAEPIVRRAVDGGVSFFDTADVYNGGQSEIVTGRLLGKLFGSREEYVVATKVHGRTMPGENGRGLSRKHILASIDASLGRLGLDYVDLYQIHRWDSLTPIEETMDVLHDVVKAGKVRYLGASSMYAWQFAKAQQVAATRFRLHAEPLQPASTARRSGR